MEENSFVENLKNAAINSLMTIFGILAVPFDLWVKAIDRLANNYDGALRVKSITGIWPLFSYLKRLFLEYLFDLMAFLSYILGPIWVLYVALSDKYGMMSFRVFVTMLISVYITPVAYAWMHDLFQFLLLPVQKLISWFKKPAQYIYVKKEDVTAKK